MENFNNISIAHDEAEMYSAGIAYIVIPKDIDRAKYIDHCYKTGTVSIVSGVNGYTNRVPIDQSTINFITFPNTVNEFGSAVSFLIDPVQKVPIIVGVYNKPDDVGELEENSFRFKRKFQNKIVDIAGSSEKSYLSLGVSSDTGGEVNVNVHSDDSSGRFNVRTAGDVNITASGNTSIEQYQKLTITTLNEDDEADFSTFEQESDTNKFSSDNHEIYTKKLSINEGEEAFLLGNKVKAFLDDLIQELSNITVTTALGQMPILNKAQVLIFKQRTESLLSKIAFIDK
ncbi:hypothetical protein [Flavitalea sp.]|nr:hypothetical protein [Flavitalea sp.]